MRYLSDPAFEAAGSERFENTLLVVVMGTPNADFGWSSVDFVGSRAAQAGLAGSPSLLTSVANPPVPLDTNTLNAPAVDDVVGGEVGAAPAVTPNDALPINDSVCCVCPKLDCPNAGWPNIGCPKAVWPNAG